MGPIVDESAPFVPYSTRDIENDLQYLPGAQEFVFRVLFRERYQQAMRQIHDEAFAERSLLGPAEARHRLQHLVKESNGGLEAVIDFLLDEGMQQPDDSTRPEAFAERKAAANESAMYWDVVAQCGKPGSPLLPVVVRGVDEVYLKLERPLKLSDAGPSALVLWATFKMLRRARGTSEYINMSVSNSWNNA